MGNDAARGLLLATRTSLAMLLTLPLLVLVGVMNSHPEAIVVLSVGLGVHAALCLLISRRLPSEGRYLLLTGVFLLLGVLSAALVNLRLGYDLSESFALIFGVVVAATLIDAFRLRKAVGLPAGFWAGLSFQAGLFLYFLFT
jgi:hypothetical protein